MFYENNRKSIDFRNISEIESFNFKNRVKDGYVLITVRYFDGTSIEKKIYSSGMNETLIIDPNTPNQAPFNPKNKQELIQKVMELYRSGCRQNQIAQRLWVSQATVSRIVLEEKKKYLETIRNKLGMENENLFKF